MHPARAGAYAAAKAAAWALTNTSREELAPHGITVSGLHVGLMDTDMTAGMVGVPKVDPAPVSLVPGRIDPVRARSWQPGRLPRTAGKPARAFLDRLKERTDNRDKAVAPSTFAAQMKAIHRWGKQAPQELSGITHPVPLANGETDTMVPSQNTVDLADRLPHAELVPLYRDAGHGGIFQYHREFTATAFDFLEGKRPA